MILQGLRVTLQQYLYTYIYRERERIVCGLWMDASPQSTAEPVIELGVGSRDQ